MTVVCHNRICDAAKFRQHQENIGQFSFYAIVKRKRVDKLKYP